MGAGVANMAWVFESLNNIVDSIRSTTLPSRLLSRDAELLVWEAFVSGDLKAETHNGDAELAVTAFQFRWPNLLSAIPNEPSVNLAAAALLAAGHTIASDEIGTAGVVVAAMAQS